MYVSNYRFLLLILFTLTITSCRLDDNKIRGAFNLDEVDLPEAHFNLTSANLAEGGGMASVTVHLDEALELNKVVAYTVSGTSSGSDHNLSSGNITIPAGQTSAQIQFNITQDVLDEDNETVDITLTENSESFELTILDDDALPSITISGADGFEGTDVEYTVTLSAASGRSVSFDYTIVNGTTTNADFAATSGTLIIPAGQTTTTLDLSTVQDNVVDTKESFDINFSNPVNATLVTTTLSSDLYELIVAATYPNTGANWNDFTMPTLDMACVFSGMGHSGCVNGGLYRSVRASAFSTCGNLTMTDSLGVLRWNCAVVGGEAVFTTREFNSGKGLKNLVTEAGWNNIKVQLRNGGPVIMESELVNTWWGNTVASLPDNSGGAVSTLNAAGTIYVEDSSKNVRGYNINADRVSVVIGSGATLTLENATPDNCNGSTSETASPNLKSLFCIGTQEKIWIEGNMLLNTVAQYAVRFEDSSIIQLHGATISGTNNDLAISEGNGNTDVYITQVTIQNTWVGIYLIGNNNFLEDVLVQNTAHTTFAGIEGYGIDDSVFNRVRVLNSASHGIAIDGLSNNVTLIDIVTANNAKAGISYTGDELKFVNILAANNSQEGIRAEDGSDQAILLNITAVNNTLSGARVNNEWNPASAQPSWVVNSIFNNNSIGTSVANNLTVVEQYFSDVFYGSNDTTLYMRDIAEIAFFGALKLENNATLCDLATLGSNVGIANTTCALSSPSTGTLSTQAGLTAALVGKAGTDSVNTSVGASTNTAIAFASVTDQSTFENWYRVWGKDGSAFPNSNNRGRCIAGTCNIWDYRIASGATAMLTMNGSFTNGAACPASVNGNNALDDAFNGNVFLKAAFEIVSDTIGDDDGLCESDEACIYSPSPGAYQGDKTGNYLTQTCNFVDGTITGVTMYAYP